MAKDCVKFTKENPVRASVYAGIASVAYGCGKTNPTYNSFDDQFKKSINQLALIFPTNQNPIAKNYLKYIEDCRNNDTLRYMSLGLFSILWIDDFSSDLATPDAKCKYLEPAYATFHERIIDVGAFGKFWNIEKAMKDYDVNF